MTNTNPLNRLALERYPRSARYDPAWILENQMGPNPLWLVEALTEVMPVPTGWRVLDLGAGTALTSIFLAKEFGVSVVAVDLWIDPSENQRRIHAAGVDQDVYRFEPRPTTYRSLTRASTRSSASTHTTTSAPVSSTFLASPTSSGQEGGSGSSSRGSWPNLGRSPHTWSTCGTPRAGPSTVPTGGGDCGSARVGCTSITRTSSATAGRSGSCGWMSVRRWEWRPIRTRSGWSATMPVGTSASPGSSLRGGLRLDPSGLKRDSVESSGGSRSCEQLPLTGNPLKPDYAERAEGEVGSRGEVANGPRDDDLPIAGVSQRPSRDVDADPSHVVVADLDLSGVDRRTDGDPEVAEGSIEAEGTSRSRRHRWSPSAAACSVEPTMSVNNTVARTRSVFCAACHDCICSRVQENVSTYLLDGARSAGW